ncbi:MAG: hypothetical protein LUG93_15725 [Lachnospiraceae bacterium]|nr:hypothetical protein [Lachnospiraceae bacterium]
MLYSYAECENKYGNHYQIAKAVKSGILYKLAQGVYSDMPNVPEFAVIAYQYPRSVFTLDSAFYYHGLTDVIPDIYYLATPKDAAKIRNPKIRQIFNCEDRFPVGISEMNRQGMNIRIYDRERMLIELIRYAKKLPFDYYKEIIESYRRTVYSLDIQRLQEYVVIFPRSEEIMKSIELEVL